MNNCFHKVAGTIAEQDSQLALIVKGCALCLATAAATSSRRPGSPFVTGSGVWRLAVADLNGDRKLDVITTNSESKSIGILLGQ